MSRLDSYITGRHGEDQFAELPGEYDPACPRCQRPASDHVELLTPDGEAVTTACPDCQWFALCENVATGTMTHPVLGWVSICDRCRDKVDQLRAD